MNQQFSPFSLVALLACNSIDLLEQVPWPADWTGWLIIPYLAAKTQVITGPMTLARVSPQADSGS